MLNDDPYFEVRDDVQHALSSATETYERWQGLLNDAQTIGGNQYNKEKKELRDILKGMYMHVCSV